MTPSSYLADTQNIRFLRSHGTQNRSAHGKPRSVPGCSFNAQESLLRVAENHEEENEVLLSSLLPKLRSSPIAVLPFRMGNQASDASVLRILVNRAE